MDSTTTLDQVNTENSTSTASTSPETFEVGGTTDTSGGTSNTDIGSFLTDGGGSELQSSMYVVTSSSSGLSLSERLAYYQVGISILILFVLFLDLIRRSSSRYRQ